MKDVTGLIVHSDQGFQYSPTHTVTCCESSRQISRCERNNCYDNVSMESFFSHRKTEGLYPNDIRSVDEAQRPIEEKIQFYKKVDHC